MDASIYRIRNRDILTLCVLALLFLGILMVQSAAITATGEVGWRWTQLGTRHLIYVCIGIVTFFLVGHLDYELLVGRRGSFSWRIPILSLLGVAVVSCVLVLIPGIGKEVNGARRWIDLPGFQIQPSELAKWGTVLFLAWWLSARPVPMDRFFRGFVVTLIPVGILCALVVLQDFGTAALIGLAAMAMLVVGQAKGWHLGVIIPPGLAAAFFAVHGLDGDSYRWRRMTAFLNPWEDPEGTGYHMIQSLLSFSTGGIFGKGLGNGIQKLGYLPEDTTDFIFAVICEELGLFGAMLTVCLYMGILYVAWQTIRTKRDSFGQLLAFGVACMIGLQAVINIAVATVSVPTKGMSLPLVSAGGSGLIITCAGLGLLYSITRCADEEQMIQEAIAGPNGAIASAA
jgi:cell division protein FtsW